MAFVVRLDEGTSVFFYNSDRCFNRDPASVNIASVLCVFSISLRSPLLGKGLTGTGFCYDAASPTK
jgi:hypothetical protein